ncbi:MAG: gliding motility-associated protein GldE [Saprospiraceae bacterium]
MDPEPPLCFLEFLFGLTGITYPGLVLGIIVLILLLISSALVSGSEVAFFSLTPHDLENLKSEDDKASSKILSLRQKPRRLLATILIANNLINIAIVVISDFLIRSFFGASSFVSMAETLNGWLGLSMNAGIVGNVLSFLITIAGVTFLLVLFGEVAPKIYANLNNLKFARVMAVPMLFMVRIFGPFSSILVNWSTRMESRFIYQRSGIDDTSKEDLDKAIELTVSSETESSEEADILRGIIKFGNVAAKQIMRSRVDVVAVEQGSGFSELMGVIKESGFSRIPVYQEDFDNIVGILYVKDLLGFAQEEDGFNWQQFIRDDVLYVPESKKIDDLLKEFQLRRLHMGIVVDEFGGSSGIVTLEDIMEEVIGEIKDEFDEDEEVDFIKINDYNFIFDGKTMLHDVARIINVDKAEFDQLRGDADSLAGLLLHHFGMIPRKDRTLVLSPFRFKIVSVSKRRIEKIHLTIL